MRTFLLLLASAAFAQPRPLPLETIKRIEVITGPGGVRHQTFLNRQITVQQRLPRGLMLELAAVASASHRLVLPTSMRLRHSHGPSRTSEI